MGEGFTWVPVNVDHPGHPDFDTMRDEYLIDSAIYREQMKARGQDVGPAVPGVNVPDDYDEADRQAVEPSPTMPEKPEPIQIPAQALACTREVAAALFGVSVNHFDRHIRPNIREVKFNKLVRYPVSELERYMNEQTLRGLL